MNFSLLVSMTPARLQQQLQLKLQQLVLARFDCSTYIPISLFCPHISNLFLMLVDCSACSSVWRWLWMTHQLFFSMGSWKKLSTLLNLEVDLTRQEVVNLGDPPNDGLQGALCGCGSSFNQWIHKQRRTVHCCPRFLIVFDWYVFFHVTKKGDFNINHDIILAEEAVCRWWCQTAIANPLQRARVMMKMTNPNEP